MTDVMQFHRTLFDACDKLDEQADNLSRLSKGFRIIKQHSMADELAEQAEIISDEAYKLRRAYSEYIHGQVNWNDKHIKELVNVVSLSDMKKR